MAAASLVVACLVVSACDQAPGVLPTGEGEPPVLSDFSFSPRRVDTVAGEDVVIPLSIQVTAHDPDDDIDRVTFVVLGFDASGSALVEGTLSRTVGARYAGSARLTIPSGEVGDYTVLAYAVDLEGTLGNEVRGALRIRGGGEPPVIDEVVAPDTLRRPAPGDPDELLELVAVVSDPDGLDNIAGVVFWNVTRPSARFEMYDNGENGDVEGGDGRYVRVVRIASSNEPGTSTLAFQARDRAGLVSNVVEKTVVVE